MFPASHRGCWLGGVDYRSGAWRPASLPDEFEAGTVPSRSVGFLPSLLPAAVEGAWHRGLA